MLVTFLVIAGSGCSRGGNATRSLMAPVMVQKLGASSDHCTLSREHTVVIDVSERALETGFRRVVDRCADLRS
jgi:hypothetical protein